MNYVYRIKKELFKEDKDGKAPIEEYMTRVFEGDAKTNLFAMPYMLDKDCSIVKGLINTLNSPVWQRNANVKSIKGRKDLERQAGLKFERVYDKTTHKASWKVVVDDDLLNEICSVHICVDTEEKDIKNLLFLEVGDFTYFNTRIINKSCPQIRDVLNKIAYRIVAPGDKARAKRNEIRNEKRNLA